VEGLQRRTIRLPDFDYTQDGAYFITVCAYRRGCLFGGVDAQRTMQLNGSGEIVRDEWLKTADIRAEVELDEYIVMPNHFHAVLFLANEQNQSPLSQTQTGANVGATCQVAPTHPRGPKSGSIGAIIGQFKRMVTIRINEQRDTPGAPVWQRNYYERVIRNESGLNDIRSYIQTNPARWAEDAENPANINLGMGIYQ